MTTLAPIHPGEHLTEILDELGISQYRFGENDRRIATPHQRNRPTVADPSRQTLRYAWGKPSE